MFFTSLGFIGPTIPNFLFALVFIWLFFLLTGNAVLGLFSRAYLSAPWSVGTLPILVDLAHPDMILREIFLEKDFRITLSRRSQQASRGHRSDLEQRPNEASEAGREAAGPSHFG